MNKLMMVAAGVILAMNASAVQVKWNSGTLMAPAADGSIPGITWDGSNNKWLFDAAGKITTAGAVQAFVWDSTSDLSFAAGDLYKWYADGQKGTPFEGITAVTGSSTASAAVNITSSKTDWTPTTTAYAAVLYVLTDASGNVWYQENDVSVKVGNSATSLQLISDFVGGGTASGAGQTVNHWTAAAVPEPTSGLLLLLGVAGLALRRRRA